MFSLSKILHRSTFIWKEDLDCIRLVLNSEKSVILNPVESKIWNLIDDEMTGNCIIKAAEKIKIDPETSKTLLKLFFDEGIITIQDFMWEDDIL